jgi:UDP-N-acetylmuramoylalanine--D-glutamate ligase
VFDLKNKKVLVLGLGGRGRAACELLVRSGAAVSAVDAADTPELRENTESLSPLGVQACLGARALPRGDFDLAVISPALPLNSTLARLVAERGWPLVSELELGCQQAQCLSLAIAGTNGKATTAGLVERMLAASHRKVLVAGQRGRPVCSIVDQTKDLDYLILIVNAFQLEATRFFRPVVSVLTDLAPADLGRYPDPAAYVAANAGLFRNQQAFDWAVVQHQALRRLQAHKLDVPGKVITYSATDPEADLRLERGLLISRLANWSGPLLDFEECRLKGPHNAENLMAALALGHVLRLTLEAMVEPLKTAEPLPHCFQPVAEINGVEYINDSKAGNLDAMSQAIRGVRPAPGGAPNVWLIAGGRDDGQQFHDAGPLLTARVKRALLIGEAAEKIRSAWSLFTPCTGRISLLEAVTEAAKNAKSGDVVLLSPACSSFDEFRNYQDRGERFCRAVKSISRGASDAHPYMHGEKRSIEFSCL